MTTDDIKGTTSAPPEKIIKNIVMSIISDFSGQGFIRNAFIMQYLSAVFGPSNTIVPIVTPKPIIDPNILRSTRSIYFQRFITTEGVRIIELFKKAQAEFKYKMVWDVDDFIFKNPEGGPAIPDYSYCSKNITIENHDAAVLAANMMDEVICSTEFLKTYMKSIGVDTKITVMPNTIPQYLYGKNKRMIREPLKKPKVLYTGSGTHYSNSQRLYGDFEGSWSEWIIKNVNEDKIDFMVLGGLPWFLEPIKNKIKVIEWMNSYQYHLPLLAWKPDIGIAPLVPNMFNYSKSNIKHIEYCALNCASIGTVFSSGMTSPYDSNILKVTEKVTVEELDMLLEKLKNPEFFNSVLKEQHAYMDVNGLYLESVKNIKLLTKIF
jgi:hypothetical protein